MIQCFMSNGTQSIFQEGILPQLISASKIDSNYTMHPRLLHCHEDRLEILFIRSGTGIYIVEGMRYPIREGDVVICNSGVLHDDAPDESKDLYTYSMAFTNVKISGLMENCLIEEGASPLLQAFEYSDMLERLIGSVYILLASGAKEMEETCSHIARGILSLVYQSTVRMKEEMKDADQKTNVLSRKIKQYIDAHYDEDLTLNTIGEALHISPYYVAHVFKDNMGYSPIQYILRRRIGEAQSLLIHTEYSITSIASMVGYNNLSHFNSMFAKYVNMSPREYRKNYTNKKHKK